jgi:hypothetical protein
VYNAKRWLRKFIIFPLFSEGTPLHDAAARGRLEVCRLLVVLKADVATPVGQKQKPSRRCCIPAQHRCAASIPFFIFGLGRKLTLLKGTCASVPPPPTLWFTHYLPCSRGRTALALSIGQNKAGDAAYLRSIGALQSHSLSPRCSAAAQ